MPKRDCRSFPPGTFQYLRDLGAFDPVKWCDRCGRKVSKGHTHWTKPGEPVRADLPKEKTHD